MYKENFFLFKLLTLTITGKEKTKILESLKEQKIKFSVIYFLNILFMFQQIQQKILSEEFQFCIRCY